MEHTLKWDETAVKLEEWQVQLWLREEGTLYITQRQQKNNHLYCMITVSSAESTGICTTQSFVYTDSELRSFIKQNGLQEKKGVITADR